MQWMSQAGCNSYLTYATKDSMTDYIVNGVVHSEL